MRVRSVDWRGALAALLCSGWLVAAPAQTGGLLTTQDLVREAVALEHGEGVPKDQARAMSLYCHAARLGDAEAQYSLGWMYANGRGIERDDAIAAAFFDMAAKQGHAQAARMRGFITIGASKLPACMRTLQMAFTPESSNWLEAVDKLPPHKRKVVELVHRLAPSYDVNPNLALAVIAVESNFNANARSPKNAQGLMQLIPETAERFRVKDAYDPTENIKGGLSYLRWLLSYYRGRVSLAAAAYNAGEGVVDRYRGVPPYPETQDYVKKILRLVRTDEHPFDARLTDPSPMLALKGDKR